MADGKEVTVKILFAIVIALGTLSLSIAMEEVMNPRIVNGQLEIINLSLGHIHAGKILTGAIETHRIGAFGGVLNISSNTTIHDGAELIAESNVTIRHNILIQGNLEIAGCMQYQNSTGDNVVLGVCK